MKLPRRIVIGMIGFVVLATSVQAMARTGSQDLPEANVPRVPWITQKTWPAVKAQAGLEGRPILIDFYATWCGPCKLLDVMVFNEKAVVEALADVVTLKADVDLPRYATMKASFDVEVLPTLIWCNSDGIEIDRFTGYVSSRQFLEIVGNWREHRTIDRALAELQAASPEDPQVLLDCARRRSQRGDDRQAEVLYRRLMNLRHESERSVVAGGMLGLAELEDKRDRNSQAVELAARAGRLYTGPDMPVPYSPDATAGLLEAVYFQQSLGDTVGSLATMRAALTLDDRNLLVMEAFARTALEAGTDLEEATRQALRAVVYSDENPELLSLLAECYHRRGQDERARRWLDQAIESEPGEQRYRVQLERYNYTNE